jgi:amidophosphoribosyltransferase
MIRHPTVYGIDMPAAAELVAHQGQDKDIAQLIGADWLIYQTLDALYDSLTEANPNIERFEDCVFTGDYVTGDIDQAYLDQLETQRNDQKKHAAQQFLSDTGQLVEIYNH